jgi:hypothetical protein
MSTSWLKANFPEFANLSLAERRTIADFTFLWTLFESRILATRGSAQKIAEVVSGWDQEGQLNADSYKKELTYFQGRYCSNGQFTHHFDALHMRPNDKIALVRSVLDGSEHSEQSRITAAFIIVLRYRNNLFHGIKWQYNLADQLTNFQNANAMLKHSLAQHGNLFGP